MLAVDLDGVVGFVKLLAGELAVLPAFYHGIDIDDVFLHGWLGLGQDLLDEFAFVFQDELVQQKPHEFGVTGVADGLVVERVHAALVGFAHGSQSARGGEGFEFLALNVDDLGAVQRRDGLADAVVDDLGVVDVLVDDTRRRPGE